VSAPLREAAGTGLPPPACDTPCHFDVPREATQADVGEALGITAKSVSERLRRGQTNLINNSLTVGQPTGVGLDEKVDRKHM
jgi:hypothetical protein